MPVQIAEKKGSIRQFQILEEVKIPNYNFRQLSPNILKGNGHPCDKNIGIAKSGDLYYDFNTEMLYGFNVNSIESYDLNEFVASWTGIKSFEYLNASLTTESISVGTTYTFDVGIESPPFPNVNDTYSVDGSTFKVIYSPGTYIICELISGLGLPSATGILNIVTGTGPTPLTYSSYTVGSEMVSSTGIEIVLDELDSYVKWEFDFSKFHNREKFKINYFEIELTSEMVSSIDTLDVNFETSSDGINWNTIFNFQTLRANTSVQIIDLSQVFLSTCLESQKYLRIVNKSGIENVTFTIRNLKISYLEDECCWERISQEEYFKKFTINQIGNNGTELSWMDMIGIKPGYYNVNVFITTKESVIFPTPVTSPTENALKLEIRIFDPDDLIPWTTIDVSGNGPGGSSPGTWYNNSLQGSLIMDATQDINLIEIRVTKQNGSFISSPLGGYVTAQYIGNL